MRIRIAALLAALALLLGAAALGEDYRIAEANQMNFGALIVDLLRAYETPSPDDARATEATLSAIESVSASDGAVARAIAEHWNRVYVNADGTYRLYLYDGGERATFLEQSSLEDSATHAFVVLGYELKNGEMTPELKGRCDAAAAAARSYPSAILICSGGATGDNNPKNHTEAGLMRDYLAGTRGIDAARIFTDERAMTTLENAVNTFEIMRAQGIETFTLVTSSYHQRWGQVLYNAMAALCGQSQGYCPRLVENYSYPIEPADAYRQHDRIAMRQLASMLRLSDEVIESIRRAGQGGGA